MKRDAWNERLSRISTIWSDLEQLHAGTPDEASTAQRLLLERYTPAVQRYLLAIVRDEAAADDLTQEFALSLIQGKFHRAETGRGRFRDYVKVTLCHLVHKYHRRQQKLPQNLPADSPELNQLPATDDDPRFDQTWRQHLLERTWQVLAEIQPTFATVLRFRTAHPKMPSHEMVEPLSEKLGKPTTADGIRQSLRRAREKFVELLVKEVAQTLAEPAVEDVEQELADLQLLELCQPVLDKSDS